MPDLAEPRALWQAALREIELQLPRATFDAWLRGSQADPDASNGRLLVHVKNEFAVAWLDDRLRPVVERSLARVARAPVVVEFAVRAADAPPDAPPPPAADATPLRGTLRALLAQISDPTARALIAEQLRALAVESPTPPEAWSPPEADTSGRWFPVPAYANSFWAPLLGSVAFRVWMLVRQHDTRPARLKFGTVWTPERRFTAPALARAVPCGAQAIKGVWRRCEASTPGATLRQPRRITGDPAAAPRPYRRQPGALETLVAEGLARSQEQGQRRHKIFSVQVHITPPLLAPAQVARLNEELQIAHDDWLAAAGIARADWLPQ